MITSTKQPAIGIGIDLGTGYGAVVIFERGRIQPVEFPIDGSQLLMVVHHEEATGRFHVGKDAILRSYDDPTDSLFMHVKRNIPIRPTESIYGGQFTPVEILTQALTFMRKALLAARPELADFPQFGGDKRLADELSIVFTVPATWTIEQHSHCEEAIHAAGFVDFDGFIAEPIAAARRLAHLNTVRLKDDDTILVVDVGAGTTDIAVLRYRQGVYHQIAAASGDGNLAGLDFTNAIAALIAEKYFVEWEDSYDQGGLNLSKVDPEIRPHVAACWFAAEEAKKHLSVLDDTAVAVEFPDGRRTLSITRDEAIRLWQPLFARFRECIQTSLDGTKLHFADIDHPMLVGGTSRVPGLREAMAEVMGRNPSDVLVCTDSEHIVAAGAAEHAFYQDDASQALESGLGLTVFDRNENRHRNLLLIAPGQILPPEGLFLERIGFEIGIKDGVTTLLCKPFACRTGVRAAVADGRDTFLEDSEIVRLRGINTELDGFPVGDHSLAIGVKADPNRKLWLLCRPTSLSQVETVSIPLALEESNGADGVGTPALSILLLLDCSGSMADDGKLDLLKKGAKKFAAQAVLRRASLNLIAFPSTRFRSEPNGIEVSRLGGKGLPLIEAEIDALTANGPTPLGMALRCARSGFPPHDGQMHQIAVVFTDGNPTDPEAVLEETPRLKQQARLITVGIGSDAAESLLRQIATDPTDYFYAEVAEDILDAFKFVSELIWSGKSV